MVRPRRLVRAAPSQLSFRPAGGHYWTSIMGRCWMPINSQRPAVKPRLSEQMRHVRSPNLPKRLAERSTSLPITLNSAIHGTSDYGTARL